MSNKIVKIYNASDETVAALKAENDYTCACANAEIDNVLEDTQRFPAMKQYIKEIADAVMREHPDYNRDALEEEIETQFSNTGDAGFENAFWK
jgi:hypothetical protein